MKKTLTLNLKAKWYNLIESGIKKEEYREIKPYWIKRLCWKGQRSIECKGFDCEKCLTSGIYTDGWCCEPFDEVTFVYGYTKRQMTFELKNIVVTTGKPEWGAEVGHNYFVIRLGERIL